MAPPNNPYQFSRKGNLFVIPVGPAIPEVDYPTQRFDKPRDYSLWVRGVIEEPDFQLDRVRMPPSMFQEVRDDLVRYSPVAVSRSAFKRSEHAYVGVIDSQGTPYYFALDSRGISVRKASGDDDRAWKTFDKLSDHEHAQALHRRRAEASAEVRRVDSELSAPVLVIKADATLVANRYALRMARASRDIASQIGDVEAVAREDAEIDFLDKALPRKAKDDSVKKTPSSKAAKKQAGAGGKTRYTYPNEKKKAGSPTKGKTSGPTPLPAGQPEHDDSAHANPGELANQLGVSVATLHKVARRLGRDGFSKFMRAHLKRFSAKHRLSPDYWGTLYERLHATDVLAPTTDR